MDKKRPVADDAPAYLAPPLDLRRVVALVEAGSAADVEEATAFALSFPIPSRPWRDAKPSGEPDRDQTLSGSPYKQAGETTVRQSPRDILVRSLLSIGPLPQLADASAERPAADRVLVGRARAIRFRIALEELWPEEVERRGKKPPPDPRVALACDAAVVVAIADGMPAEGETTSPHDLPMVKALVDDARARFPQLGRRAFKDACVTSLARSTLLGFQRALQYVKNAAADATQGDRAACFETARRLSLVPAINDHRALAIGGLRRALAI
jgi:hypothetical protein